MERIRALHLRRQFKWRQNLMDRGHPPDLSEHFPYNLMGSARVLNPRQQTQHSLNLIYHHTIELTGRLQQPPMEHIHALHLRGQCNHRRNLMDHSHHPGLTGKYEFLKTLFNLAHILETSEHHR